MTFAVFGITASDAISPRNGAACLVAASCRSCGFPIMAYLVERGGSISPEGMLAYLTQLSQHGRDLLSTSAKIEKTWPEAPTPVIPDALPSDVARAFAQAEDNFTRDGNEEAAAMMYRRAIEIGLRTAYPTYSGSLASRIKKLVIENHLPSAIGDWMDQVRLIGNDGAHEIEGVSRADLEAARGFVDTALRYIFTMPAQVAERRGLPVGVA